MAIKKYTVTVTQHKRVWSDIKIEDKNNRYFGAALKESVKHIPENEPTVMTGKIAWRTNSYGVKRIEFIPEEPAKRKEEQ